MTSSPIDKIMEALAASNSKDYVEENSLALLDRKQEVMNMLAQLVMDRKIFCCKITKAGRSFNAYWLPFHVVQSKREQHSALFVSGGKNKPRPEIKPRKIIKNQAMSRVNLEEKPLPDRWCKSCEMKHPATEFAHSRSRRCIPSNLIYEQNKREIQLERVRQWRQRKKAAHAIKSTPKMGNKVFSLRAPSSHPKEGAA